MKLLCLACPHGDDKFLKIPLDGIDAVLIAGDLGKADKLRALRMKYPDAPSLSEKVTKEELVEMTEEPIESAEKLLAYFSKKPTYFVFGNVEQTKEAIEKKNKKYGTKIVSLEDRIKNLNVQNIENKIAKIGKLKIAGLSYFVETSWNENFLGKPKHRTQEEKEGEEAAKKFLSNLEKVDILLTHNPPYNYLDLVDNPIVPKSWNGKHAGSKLVLEYIKKKKPRVVICGHIHEGKDTAIVGETKIVNISQSWFVLNI